MRSAITTGLNDSGTETLGDVSVPFQGGDLTVFSMDNVESFANGGVGTAVTDAIRSLLSASLYLAFGFMVFQQAKSAIKGLST